MKIRVYVAFRFQYFFFKTYPGFFLEVLPFSLLAGLIFLAVRRKGKDTSPKGQKAGACLFVCYVSALFCLVLLLDVIRHFWSLLLYGQPYEVPLQLFSFRNYNIIPDFFTSFDGESLGNILAFLPFGILYPLFRPGSPWKKTVFMGFLCSLTIELLQPMLGRAFDINDIILNTAGVILTASVYELITKNRSKA